MPVEPTNYSGLIELVKLILPTLTGLISLCLYYRETKRKKIAEIETEEARTEVGVAEAKLKLAQAGKLVIETDQIAFNMMAETVEFLRIENIRLSEILVATQNDLLSTKIELDNLKIELTKRLSEISVFNSQLKANVSRLHLVLGGLHRGVLSLIEQLKRIDPDIEPVYKPPDLTDVWVKGL